MTGGVDQRHGRRSWGPVGSFPRPPAHLQHNERSRQDSVRVTAALERVWGIQRQLDMPRGKLHELVMASLQSIRPLAAGMDMALWVDMLCAIQHGIDGQSGQARAMADELAGAEGPANRDPGHARAAQVIAHFYIGLLEASPLLPVAPQVEPSPQAVARHLDGHRRAQIATKAVLHQMAHAGLKPPHEFAPLVGLINVLVSALHGLPDPPGGYLHMIVPATADGTHTCECLYAYGLTQMTKGRSDRAALAMQVCRGNALRRGHRLIASLVLSTLHQCRHELDPGLAGPDHALESEAILAVWRGQSTSPGALPDAGQEAIRRADRIQMALAFIASHLDVRFTATELANVCGVSSRTVSDDFRAVFHKTVLAYVTEERMRVALTLLQDRSLSLEEVARQVGFQSAFGFSKAFYRTYGHLPARPMSAG